MEEKVVASKYQIACSVNDSAYVSHLSAFEYHHLTNKVYSNVYVSSFAKVRPFDFEGIHYSYIPAKVADGVTVLRATEGVRVTDVEKTVADSINDFDKIGGLDEVVSCLAGVGSLDEEKLITYLKLYNSKMLYQKTGFLLEKFSNSLQLSPAFFNFCRENIASSTRYLSRYSENSGVYNGDWRLIVPQDLTK